MSSVVYCCLLLQSFFALISKLKTVIKVGSVFVQDEKHGGSMIYSETLEAICSVVDTTAGSKGTGWLLIGSDADRNFLRDI